MDAPSFENAVAERDGCERVMCWRAKMRLSLPVKSIERASRLGSFTGQPAGQRLYFVASHSEAMVHQQRIR